MVINQNLEPIMDRLYLTSNLTCFCRNIVIFYSKLECVHIKSGWIRGRTRSHNGEIVSWPPTYTLSHPPPHFNHDCHKISLRCLYCTVLSFLLLILICFLQLNISFNDKTEVFEYPSFEPVSPVQTMVQSSEEEPDVVSRLKSNTPVGSSGDTASFMSAKQCNILNSLLCPVNAG